MTEGRGTGGSEAASLYLHLNLVQMLPPRLILKAPFLGLKVSVKEVFRPHLDRSSRINPPGKTSIWRLLFYFIYFLPCYSFDILSFSWNKCHLKDLRHLEHPTLAANRTKDYHLAWTKSRRTSGKKRVTTLYHLLSSFQITVIRYLLKKGLWMIPVSHHLFWIVCPKSPPKSRTTNCSKLLRLRSPSRLSRGH